MQFEQNKADALACSLQHDKSKKNFWQRLKIINKKSASYPTSVSGLLGASKVAEMWGTVADLWGGWGMHPPPPA